MEYVVATEGPRPFGKAVWPAPVARIPLCRVRLPVTLPPIVQQRALTSQAPSPRRL